MSEKFNFQFDVDLWILNLAVLPSLNKVLLLLLLLS